MKNNVATKILLISTVLLSACATSLEHVASDFNLDDWKVGYVKDVPGNGNIIEFVPSNESVEVWSKIVTIKFFEGNVDMPWEFMHHLRSTMRKRCPEVEWNVIDEETNHILYEWVIDNCNSTPSQHEIAKLLRGNDGLHRFAYAEKTERLSKAARELWIGRISNSYLEKENTRVVVQ